MAMAGLHPCSVKENYKKELRIVEDILAKKSFAAIGEIGLDFYWDRTFEQQQYESFHQQIQWALHYDLPIVIHSRESMESCIEVVGQYQRGKLKGIFHCFTGSAEQAGKIIDLGLYLGIGGVITYKNAGLAETLKNIGMDSIVLETDAPYLTPVPFRGKRNESSYIKYIAQKLADVKNIDITEVEKITTSNAEKIFKA
jgi:TatD DNase family protein